MIELTNQHLSYFRAFGFVVIRQALDNTLLAALETESDCAIKEATGPHFMKRNDQGGIEGHFIPATGERTPVSLKLAQDLAPIAEEIMGVELILSIAHHIVFLDASGWHTDTGHAVQSVKIAAYLDPLNAANGALRVIPGSHALPEEHFEPVMSPKPPLSEDNWRGATRDMPCHVIDTQPGDVIVFDEHLWHASVDGRDRRQWSVTYVRDPATADEEAGVRDYLESQFDPGMELDYDPALYPCYGAFFRQAAPKRWVSQLKRLGAFDAAAKEEGSA